MRILILAGVIFLFASAAYASVSARVGKDYFHDDLFDGCSSVPASAGLFGVFFQMRPVLFFGLDFGCGYSSTGFASTFCMRMCRSGPHPAGGCRVLCGRRRELRLVRRVGCGGAGRCGFGDRVSGADGSREYGIRVSPQRLPGSEIPVARRVEWSEHVFGVSRAGIGIDESNAV